MIVGQSACISEVRAGSAKPFGPNGEPSAIDKTPVIGVVDFNETGLCTDDQGDLVHHGGKDKAIHAYPRSHYAIWRSEFPELTNLLIPGAFGENLVIEDVREADICLGDIFTLGTGRIQVSQARQPCWKLNWRFQRPDMAYLVQRTGRTGWYFRVLENGCLPAAADLTLCERSLPEWPLTRVHALLYSKCLDREALSEFHRLPGLPRSWRALAERRLSSGRVEDWTARLTTPH